ncbi:autotransporter domain-containing protein [Pontiellaceae bacterium B1224]|nr:autotransporter domain-containing protein [Pontiellaceae bacterium B1224]
MNYKQIFCISTVMALAFSAFADDSVQIENQWTYNAESATWGSVYVGKYTTNNTLQVIPYWEEGTLNDASLETDEAYVGYSDSAHDNFVQLYGGVDYEITWEEGVPTVTTNIYKSVWSAEDLVIGTDANSNNTVWVGWLSGVTTDGMGLEAGGMGTLEVDGDLTINGASNGNSLVIGDYGTLKITGDMDASMAGFSFYGSNSVLAVGGTLTGIQNLDGGYQELQLFGEDAAWAPSNGTVIVGGTTDSNTLSIVEGASLSLTNLSIGSAGTHYNNVQVRDSGELSIFGSIELLEGASNSNYLEVSEGGILNAFADFEHTGSSTNINSGLQLRDGTANFYGDFAAPEGLLMDAGTINLYGYTNSLTAVDGNGIITLAGTGSVWQASELILGGLTEAQIPTNTGVSLGAVNVYIQDGNILSVDHFSLGTGGTNLGCSITIENGGHLILTNSVESIHDRDDPLIMESGSKVTYVMDAVHTDAPSLVDTGVTYEFLSEGFIMPGLDRGDWDEYGYYSQRYESTNIFNGAGAALNYNSYNVHVGDLDSGNALIFTNGASGSVNTLTIGDFEEGGDDNLVLVSGVGSTFAADSYIAVGGTIIADEWHNGGDNNTLRVEDGAYLTTKHFYNQNTGSGSGLEIASGALVEVDSYYQGSGAKLTIMTDSSGTNVGHLAASEAEFESGAMVGVDAVSRLTIDQSYTNSIITAGTLIVGGVTNGTSLAALSGSGGSIVYYDLSLEDGTNIVAVYSRRSLVDSGEADSGAILDEISDEIDEMASAGNAAASNQLEILNLMSASEVTAQMNQLYSYGIPTYQHNQALFGGLDQALTRGVSFHDKSPVGVYGPAPHNPDQGFQPWIDVYGGFGNRDQSGNYDNGYDSSVYGTVIGVDRAFGELLVGLAGGYAGSLIKGENGDESDASTAYGILYASYGTRQWFADLSLGLGSTSMDNTSGTAFDVASSADASQAAVYAGIGYEMFNEDSGTVVRPLLALQSSLFSQDAYTETATTAVAKDVDGYDRWSLQSVMGAEIIAPKSGLNVDFETQLRAYWLHEYNDDTEVVDYTLVGSSQIGQFEMRAPESDLALLGIGFVAKLENRLQLRADIDGQIGKDYYSTLFSGAMRYEF